MRKADYNILASTLKADIDALNAQRDKQMLIGLNNIKAPPDSVEFNNAYAAVKALESKIAYIKLLAQSLSMKLSVDRKAFLRECGIYSGPVFD